MQNEKTVDFEALRPVFATTGGLLLSQVCFITGVEASTIQNWVKRGWVTAPDHKRYGEFQVARILVIDTLRSALSLDKIVNLMTYVNGRVDDRTDDIIDDCDLYVLIKKGITALDELGKLVSEKRLVKLVDDIIGDYRGPLPDSRQRLTGALKVMLLGYLSAKMKASAEEAYAALALGEVSEEGER